MKIEIVSDQPTRPRSVTGRVVDGAIIAATRRMVSGIDPAGTLTVTAPDGRRYRLSGDRPGYDADIEFRNLNIIRNAMRRGSLGFAQTYLEDDLTTSDLVRFFRFYLSNEDQFTASRRGLFRVRVPDRLYNKRRANTRAGSRRNIAEHYDLSNDFYALWLDESMTYSSAYFDDGANDLPSAQRAKYRKVMDALDLSEEHHVLEIGCGWGGFAETAVEERGAQVTGISLSNAQLDYARERIARSGIDDRCTLNFQDYRDTTGTYDRIASIEMIEAVGAEYWQTYFSTLADRLRRSGVAAIQAITIGEPYYDDYRRGVDFIRRYIFPGGMLPTPTIIEREARRAGLVLDGVETFARSYARTLREWRQTFLKRWPSIADLGFDEEFRRKWEYYLAYCEAGFLEGRIDVGIYRLVKPA